jgi:hypothetical protein
MKIYIAGPMRGRRNFNREAFNKAEVELERTYPDAIVYNPARVDFLRLGHWLHSETGDLEDVPDFDLREAMAVNMEWICTHATHVYMLAEWWDSEGASAEYELANALGLEVLYQKEDVKIVSEFLSAPSNTFDPEPREPFEKAVAHTFKEAQDILLRKHHDYGPKNISMAPGGPLNGLRVRMWDKISRLSNLMDKNTAANYESLEDTLLDLGNYALIGVLVLRRQWPMDYSEYDRVNAEKKTT